MVLFGLIMTEDTDNCNILPETPNEYYNFILDRLNENDFIR